jgi:hypothetical protein
MEVTKNLLPHLKKGTEKRTLKLEASVQNGLLLFQQMIVTYF